MTTFIIPDNVAFECQQCGMCCRNKWTIPAEPAALERFRSAQMLAVYPDVAQRTAPFDSPPFTHKLEKTPDGACVFLTSQNTCGIHARVGREFKPANCILFPYQFTRTPRGVTVGMVFDCTGVNFESNAKRAGLDPATLEDVYRHALTVHELPAAFRLHENGPEVDYAAYEKMQQILMRFLEPGVFPLEDGLIAGSVLLRLGDEFLREAVGKGYTAPKAMAAFFRNVEAEDHALVRRLMKDFGLDPDEQRAFFDFLIQSHETTSDTKGRMEMAAKLMKQAWKRRRGKDDYRSKFLGRDLSLGAAAGIPFDPEAEPANGHLRRYLAHLVFRHLLVEHFPSLQLGQLYLMVVYGVVRWYARALAHGEGAPAVEGRHVREAIRVVETNFVFSNKLHQRLATEGHLKREFDRILEDKLTPYRLVRSS